MTFPLSSIDRDLINLKAFIDHSGSDLLAGHLDQFRGVNYGHADISADRLIALRNAALKIHANSAVAEIHPNKRHYITLTADSLIDAINDRLSHVLDRQRLLCPRCEFPMLVDLHPGGAVAAYPDDERNHPMTYGQACDYAISTGKAVVAEIWGTRYVYDQDAASLLCINDERPAHVQIAGSWRMADDETAPENPNEK